MRTVNYTIRPLVDRSMFEAGLLTACPFGKIDCIVWDDEDVSTDVRTGWSLGTFEGIAAAVEHVRELAKKYGVIARPIPTPAQTDIIQQHAFPFAQ